MAGVRASFVSAGLLAGLIRLVDYLEAEISTNPGFDGPITPLVPVKHSRSLPCFVGQNAHVLLACCVVVLCFVGLCHCWRTRIAVMASLIGPFGGFLASGLKRAYNVKDFGNT